MYFVIQSNWPLPDYFAVSSTELQATTETHVIYHDEDTMFYTDKFNSLGSSNTHAPWAMFAMITGRFNPSELDTGIFGHKYVNIMAGVALACRIAWSAISKVFIQ